MENHTVRLTPEQQVLVEQNLRLVFAGMKRYNRLFRYIDREEMQASFNHAICRAAASHNPEKANFSTWAFWWFRHAITCLTKDSKRRGLSGEHAQDSKYADLSGIDTGNHVRRWGDRGESLQLDGLSLSVVPRNNNSPQREQQLAEMREEYSRLKQFLTPKQIQAIEGRMAGQTLEVISKAMNISRERVRQHQEKAIDTMKQNLTVIHAKKTRRVA